MKQETLFLQLNIKVKTTKDKITLGDIARLYCNNTGINDGLKNLEIYRLMPEDGGKCVISVLKVIQIIKTKHPELIIESIGENAVIIDKVKEGKQGTWSDYLKIITVSSVCFFGTVFTVMAYHNDINITALFERVNEIVRGTKGNGFSFLEISYSLGLSLGIIIFYNHIGKRTLTKDPTPIAVEMRTYEADVNRSLVELADREGKTIDVN